MTTHDQELVDALARGLRPRRYVSFPDWCDEHLVLQRGGQPFRWQTSLTPYLRQPMLDASPDSPVEELVIMKPSQVGASEAFAVAFPMYMADVAPCNVLEIRPDLDEAARFKQLRIDTIIASSPYLRALFREKKSRDSGNTQHLLVFDGGSWTILGSNSPAGLSSLPAAVVIFDERDRMAASAGVGARAEGDQYLLAKARTITFRDSFPRRKLIQISSPGETSTSRIEPAWLASDRRRYHVPCSECGAMIKWLHSRLWWPRGADPRTARYRCQVCDRLLDERAKSEQLAAGEWVAECPERDVHGYKLVGLDSPFMLWGELAEEREKVKGKPNELRVYVNTKEGESYDSHQESRVDIAQLKLLACEVKFVDDLPVVPAGVGLLTGGTDTQPNRLEFTLRGWGRDEEQWHIDHVILPGDPSVRAVWDDLDQVSQTLWETEGGMSIGLGAMCVDTAGHNTIGAYNFVRGKASRRIWGTVGRGGMGKRLWPRKPSRANIGKVDLYTIGVDAAKEQLYQRLKASVEQVLRGDPPGGPGFVHIAAHLCEDVVKPDGTIEPSEYLQQLVSETPKTVLKKTGPVIEWDLPAHKRNEALDCDVLAQAALAGWKALRRSLNAAVERMNPGGMPRMADQGQRGPVPQERPRGVFARWGKRTSRAKTDFAPNPGRGGKSADSASVDAGSPGSPPRVPPGNPKSPQGARPARKIAPSYMDRD